MPGSPAPTPTTEDELSQLVRAAAAERRPLHSFGSGSKRHLGPDPDAGAQPICTRGLARIVDYEPGDMVISVQAGVRLADLQRQLSARGQWLPVDPPHAESTIGGMLATGSSGPRRLGYGPPRDHVLGMRVANAAGTVTKSGGKVVKNVSGFDLHKLQVGAMGSLGVITEVSLKVATRPAVRVMFVVPCPTLTVAHEILLQVWTSALRPVALEALEGTSAAALPGVHEAPGGALALIGVEGPRSFVERHVRELIPPGLPAMPQQLENEQADAVWAALRDAASALRDRIVVRVGARPHDLPRLLAELGPRQGTQVHAATGIARVVLPAGVQADEARALVQLWHKRASAVDGYALVESAPVGLAGRDALPWNPLPTDLLRSLLLRWDPERIMNRGRMPL